MGRWSGKIFGGGLGYLFGGPIGAILGVVIGEFIDQVGSESDIQERARGRRGGYTARPPEREEVSPKEGYQIYFITSLASLFMAVARADGDISREEVKRIKEFFVQAGFPGEDLSVIRRILNQVSLMPVDLKGVCADVATHTDERDRVELLRMLYTIAYADKVIKPEEERVLDDIARNLNIPEREIEMLRAEYMTGKERYYRILGITRGSNPEEVKSAYRSLARKYHPDRVSHLGEEFQRLAEEKFKLINEAYLRVKEDMGFA